jgi:anti-sigma-K factor RskA
MTEFPDDEAFAAEYVLGTLDWSERTDAEARRRRDPHFEQLIRAWETRLSPLAAAVPDLAPPATLLDGILSRLPSDEPARPAENILIMRRQLRLWRNIAAVASALAAVLAVWVVAREAFPPAPPNQTYVAVLQHGADTPSFVVSLDLGQRRMTVLPLSTSAPPDKSYQLWMIGSDQAKPRSIGVIDAQDPIRSHLPDVNDAALSNATYAVTLEPHGGSPTGQPTSTPVFVGKLVHTAL